MIATHVRLFQQDTQKVDTGTHKTLSCCVFADYHSQD
jgi:hypothetical protein